MRSRSFFEYDFMLTSFHAMLFPLFTSSPFDTILNAPFPSTSGSFTKLPLGERSVAADASGPLTGGRGCKDTFDDWRTTRSGGADGAPLDAAAGAALAGSILTMRRDGRWSREVDTRGRLLRAASDSGFGVS
jgi:hypothetical protein